MNKSPVVMLEIEMTIRMNHTISFLNDKNKYRLIYFLGNDLVSADIQVKQAWENANRLIVSTAVEQLNLHQKVAVVGQDVDLFVLLIALTPLDRDINFIKQGSGISTV